MKKGENVKKGFILILILINTVSIIYGSFSLGVSAGTALGVSSKYEFSENFAVDAGITSHILDNDGTIGVNGDILCIFPKVIDFESLNIPLYAGIGVCYEKNDITGLPTDTTVSEHSIGARIPIGFYYHFNITTSFAIETFVEFVPCYFTTLDFTCSFLCSNFNIGVRAAF